MKKLGILSFITIFTITLFSSCGGSGTTESTETATKAAEPKKEVVKPTETSGLEAQLAKGKEIYDTKCVVCHQADAKGLKGAFPPLANADYLVADLKRAVAQTLNGSNEEMVVNGETYIAPMTPQVETIEDAVAVINYVLKQFNGFTDDQLVKVSDVSDIEIKPKQ